MTCLNGGFTNLPSKTLHWLDPSTSLVAKLRDARKNLNSVYKYIKKFIYNINLWTFVASTSWIAYQLFEYIYIYIYITKQNKSNLTITQNTELHNSNQKINEKKNTNHHKTTSQGSEPTNPIKKLKIKTANLIITHITKSTKPIKEQKKIASFIHKPPQRHRGQKKISRASPIVGVVGSKEFK